MNLRRILLSGVVFALTGLFIGRALRAAPETERRRSVAVTIDDLPGPVAGVLSNRPADLATMTKKLLAALAEHSVPAVGFVNEGKLVVAGEGPAEFAARVELLRLWTSAGFELGNHTYSHRSFNKLSLDEFESDIVRGEPETRKLLAEKGLALRYFRHPFLQVGLDLPKRRALEAYLRGRGYVIAPVTIDNDEYVFAFVYADAMRRSERALAARVAADYLIYMDKVFAFFEELSLRQLGREPAEVLLIHANALNSDHFGELAGMMEKRGYRFATLEATLRDPAYALPDDYVGGWGISWIHHWETTAGKPRTPSPDPPPWIQAAYDALPQ
ncbi:MAG: polysaccharide deacetylase family protein [Thermoanaerobaculia bacterium]